MTTPKQFSPPAHTKCKYLYAIWNRETKAKQILILHLQEVKRETNLLLIHGCISWHKNHATFITEFVGERYGILGCDALYCRRHQLSGGTCCFHLQCSIYTQSSSIPDAGPIIFAHQETTWHITSPDSSTYIQPQTKQHLTNCHYVQSRAFNEAPDL